MNSNFLKLSLFFCTLFLLANCSKIDQFASLFPGGQNLFKNKNKAEINRENITKLPYASLSAKIHSDTPSRLVLGQGMGNQLFWYSSEKEVIVTECGRIVRTHGLQHDLLRIDLGNNPYFQEGLHKIEHAVKAEYKIDLNHKNLQNLNAIAYINRIKLETITIYEIPYETYRISEKVTVPEINWQFENLYWVHVEDGFIWKSKQNIHPELQPIEYSVLKRFKSIKKESIK